MILQIYWVFSHISSIFNFSAYLTIFCSYCKIILYMGRVCYHGPNVSVCKIFFSSYSDLYYKTRTFGKFPNNWYPSFINSWLLITITYRPSLLCAEFVCAEFVWAEFVICRVCYGPSLLCAELIRWFACARLGFMVQCFLVESNSLLLKNGSFFSSFCSFFLQVKWYTQEKFNHGNKYWCCEHSEIEQISRL